MPNPMSLPQLRRQLSDIEPDEHTYANIGPEEIPLLQRLLTDPEAWLAARAVYALSRIDSPSAHAALLAAAGNRRPEVRIAVAASAAALPPTISNGVLLELLRDGDVGVRKFAIKSSSNRNSLEIKRRVGEIATTDPNMVLRGLAKEKARSVER